MEQIYFTWYQNYSQKGHESIHHTFLAQEMPFHKVDFCYI